MPVTLKKGQKHTFNGPQGDYVTVTNENGDQGSFEFSYSSGKSQSFTIGGYATKNETPKEWPVTVTNTGNPTLSVGVD